MIKWKSPVTALYQVCTLRYKVRQYLLKKRERLQAMKMIIITLTSAQQPIIILHTTTPKISHRDRNKLTLLIDRQVMSWATAVTSERKA